MWIPFDTTQTNSGKFIVTDWLPLVTIVDTGGYSLLLLLLLLHVLLARSEHKVQQSNTNDNCGIVSVAFSCDSFASYVRSLH